MKGGLPMGFLDWAAVVLGVGLIVSGVRAVRRRRADVPEPREGVRAVGLGWLRVGLGVLFLVAAFFDVQALKTVFRLFLEAAS